MKKLFLLIVILFLTIACQKKVQQRYFADSNEIQTLKSGIVAYESGDWNGWKNHFSDTAKIFVNSIKPVSVNERMGELKAMSAAMSSYGFIHDKEYIEMVLDKDQETWVYYWATHENTFASSNKALTIPVHLAVRFVEGKIVEEHVYFDGTNMNAEFAALSAAATDTINSTN